MLNITICDDEQRILVELKKQIESILGEKEITSEFHLYSSCEELLKEYHEVKTDFLFLDIDMPGMTGFELASKLNQMEQKSILIFVTNQDALVYESFSFRPFAFIRKAYFMEEIEGVLERALAEIEQTPEYYTFQSNGEIVRVPIHQMIYFESQGNYVRLVMKDVEYKIRETISNLTMNLENSGFIRIHKGFLVNQQYVMAIRQNEVELEDHTLLAIGRSNKEMVKKKLMKYLR